MVNQLSWKVGGQQGEGIDSTGEIFATALNRLGYHLFGYRHFSSRIKGGHTNYKIRVTTKSMKAISDNLDILVAFDQETIDLNSGELRDGGVIIADSKFKPVANKDNVRLLSVPFTEISRNLGNILMKNMVALGATSALLGLSIESFKEIIEEMFLRKGQEVVDKNMEALKQGAEYVNKETNGPLEELRLAEADGKKRLFMTGNEAVALGAIAAGVRFMPAYPITPASEVMEYLIKKLPKFGGTVIQTEDEIAAVTMAIGASYGGVRTMTSTSGPGLALMQEAIGLAGITETPLVIVDVQRGGPSTGLPTKNEQSDFNAAIFGTHGEIPKIVIAPNSIEDAFYDTVEAFNLADRYQCPVIVLTDLALGMGKQTVEPLDYDKIEIDRGKYLGDQELPELEGELYKRYLFTEDGISPRVIPGQKNGIHHVTGVEHAETGLPSENPVNRKKMMEKRLNKINNIKINNPVIINKSHDEAEILVIGIGSTHGAIAEAVSRLEKDGYKINQAHIRLIHPLPKDQLKELMEKAKKVIVVENNGTGQIANLLNMNFGMIDKVKSLLKYDGNPFLPSEIYDGIRGLI
ncbi:2-oxoglutarate ferredoxin oxidoreductase subunit alpha [Vulcanibacillus modesticaldus]|uniref:2-oxoglutarate ferredoxin oxidoreductase subunit alpha n=1 Tax=Vulcanibacillus modesticaldus TaxID=337097 RepID=A0A1D2YXR9_9BACI|nr:2-oxoacid:acceptor oxidoreductase subunit alpha [Vulcanibacillus modesticaldus]OEG00479.1 2-oxoglutarate ferredoxin oxidoreductase subunit alpha [Vulcanibacillus modesticaldus]